MTDREVVAKEKEITRAHLLFFTGNLTLFDECADCRGAEPDRQYASMLVLLPSMFGRRALMLGNEKEGESERKESEG